MQCCVELKLCIAKNNVYYIAFKNGQFLHFMIFTWIVMFAFFLWTVQNLNFKFKMFKLKQKKHTKVQQ